MNGKDISDLVLKIENLVVHYETEDGTVEAVNGIDLQLERKRTRFSWRNWCRENHDCIGNSQSYP